MESYIVSKTVFRDGSQISNIKAWKKSVSWIKNFKISEMLIAFFLFGVMNFSMKYHFGLSSSVWKQIV